MSLDGFYIGSAISPGTRLLRKVVWKCLVPTFFIVFISSLLITGHALLRDPKQIESSSNMLLDGSYDDDEDLEGGHGGPTRSENITLLDDRGEPK